VKVLDRLPFEPHHSTVDTAAGPVAVRAFQIVVWLSFRLEGILSRPFPAVLDTGHSHNFSINEALLESWLNLRIDQFRPRAMTKVDGEKLPLRSAELVLHRNVPTTRAIGRDHYDLSIPQGIVIYPKTTAYPRMPILGLRALVNSRLRVVINGRTFVVSADTGWFG
jgi:hypothetical protein